VFPVRYELNSYISGTSNLLFKGLKISNRKANIIRLAAMFYAILTRIKTFSAALIHSQQAPHETKLQTAGSRRSQRGVILENLMAPVDWFWNFMEEHTRRTRTRTVMMQ
jgi:hypothetical protein